MKYNLIYLSANDNLPTDSLKGTISPVQAAAANIGPTTVARSKKKNLPKAISSDSVAAVVVEIHKSRDLLNLATKTISQSRIGESEDHTVRYLRTLNDIQVRCQSLVDSIEKSVIDTQTALKSVNAKPVK